MSHDSSEAFVAEFERRRDSNMGQLLLKAARLYNEQAVELLRAAGYADLRPSHTSLFPHLELDGTRLTTLAVRMGVSKQAVGQLVDDLEAMDLLERLPDPSDRRAKLVRYTQRGKRSLFEGLDALAALEVELSTQLSERERSSFVRTLERIIAVLQSGR